MKFEQTGDLSVLPGRERKSVSIETVEEVAADVVERASSSVCSSHLYRIHVMQSLKTRDHKNALNLLSNFFARMEVDDAWLWKILWPEEHFCLEGAVNSRNCRIWCTSPPNVMHQQPLHSDYVAASCGFIAEFILGPFFGKL
ncbi:uncharacterized protein TNCV_1575311 [Trichonephila clavipes]|nr:uncharacterized protein TNCV_1575311 [Trichonephila clavipes]